MLSVPDMWSTFRFVWIPSTMNKHPQQTHYNVCCLQWTFVACKCQSWFKWFLNNDFLSFVLLFTSVCSGMFTVLICRFLRGTCKQADGTCPFSHKVAKEKVTEHRCTLMRCWTTWCFVDFNGQALGTVCSYNMTHYVGKVIVDRIHVLGTVPVSMLQEEVMNTCPNGGVEAGTYG